MNKILGILTFCLMLSSVTVYAEDYDALDVFEEYAVSDALFVTEDMSVQTQKNQSVDDILKYTSDGGEIQIEIVTPPEHGQVTLIDDVGSFTYTPATDWIGTDVFQFKIGRDEEFSNISHCTIIVSEIEEETPEIPGFVYEDMRTHWGNYSALKLVESDIVKGERIGNRYYFYPETQMRRIDVIEYILSALKVNFDEVDKNETHIFADSTQLPEYINESAYLANKIGFVEGVREGEHVFLRPYEYIVRAEIIRMIDIAMNSKTRNGDELTFTDEKTIPDWAAQSVKNLVGYGIIHGYEDNTLRPYAKITKAQTAEMIYQMMKYNEQNTSETMATRIKQSFYGKLTA